jgi:hypothetical protein
MTPAQQTRSDRYAGAKAIRLGRVIAALTIALALADSAAAQVIAPEFASDYTYLDLGGPSGVPGSLGGLSLKRNDPNTLLIGGSANGPSGAIHSIGLVRDAQNHIIGFDGVATVFATAPYIDGGLAYGPGGVLFATGYPNNTLMQYVPGAASPSKTISLSGLGIGSSVGSLGFVPSGFAGAGKMTIVSYNTGQFWSADLVGDGSGTYDLANLALQATLGGGPEGVIWVPPGSPGFAGPSILVSEYGFGRIGAYDLDATGAPILASRRDFITGLSGAEGAFIDPLTGDFLFSTFGGGNRVVVVRGFAPVVPEPASLALTALGLAGGVAIAWRSRARGEVPAGR